MGNLILPKNKAFKAKVEMTETERYVWFDYIKSGAQNLEDYTTPPKGKNMMNETQNPNNHTLGNDDYSMVGIMTTHRK